MEVMFLRSCQLLEIRKTRTSVRHPQGNGQTERFNRTLIKMIKAYLSQEQKDWDLYLGCLAGAYRASPHETTGITPNMLVFGREIRMPVEVLYTKNTVVNQKSTSLGDHMDSLRSKMQIAHEIARRYQGVCSRRSKELHDVRISYNNYKQGDMVWCLLEERKVGIAPKLQPLYAGPFPIKRKLSDINFILQLDKDGKEKIVHHDKLKPYEGTQCPKWMSSVGKGRKQPIL